MSHLGESLNDLLGPNLIASHNSYKREGGNGKVTSQLVFHAVRDPPSPKEETVLRTIFTKI